MARAVSCHVTEDRWALLYTALWRCTHNEPQLLDLRGDPLVRRLHERAKAVHRDCHKMHAFVRFRRVLDRDDGERFVAWFEPEHHIVERTAEFFRERFTNMRWSILTPRRSAHWEGAGKVWFTDGVERRLAPESDELEQAWRVYYRSIFNPARLKLDAMRAEMPQKYWRNLPEATEISALVTGSDDQLHRMLTTRKSSDDLQCGPPPSTYTQRLELAQGCVGQAPLSRLALALKSCGDCPLWTSATQAVPGCGPEDATIMLVGEQPGDQEDLRGEVFIGPAGQLLDRALLDVGLDRNALYLTNAVKHFKFTPRGKRRLHQRPNEAEQQACRPWLQREIALVNPRLIVCLGRTAARAVLGKSVHLDTVRGRVIQLPASYSLLVTAHPAAVLRVPGENGAAYAALVADLAIAAQWSEPGTLQGTPE